MQVYPVIRSAKPALALQRYIRCYYQCEASLSGEGALQPVPARSAQAIEFTFGTPFEVRRLNRNSVEGAHQIAAIGAQTFHRVDLVMRGFVDTFTIVLQASGLLRVFSLPGHELTDDHFEGEVALSGRLGELYRRLSDSSSFAQRVQIADVFLARRVTNNGPASWIAESAIEIVAQCGNLRISELAESTGVSSRQFERRFLFEIGITPKLYARIVRFESALRRKRLAPESRWTAIAHDLGYHDQTHMVHDFRQFSGDSPSRIADQLEMFVGPEASCSVVGGPHVRTPA